LAGTKDFETWNAEKWVHGSSYTRAKCMQVTPCNLKSVNE